MKLVKRQLKSIYHNLILKIDEQDRLFQNLTTQQQAWPPIANSYSIAQVMKYSIEKVGKIDDAIIEAKTPQWAPFQDSIQGYGLIAVRGMDGYTDQEPYKSYADTIHEISWELRQLGFLPKYV
jgi:hypothetical protein